LSTFTALKESPASLVTLQRKVRLGPWPASNTMDGPVGDREFKSLKPIIGQVAFREPESLQERGNLVASLLDRLLFHAQEYNLYLPSKEELRQKLDDWGGVLGDA
jgi:hypothetical protein